jgi:fluoride exporter
VMKLHVGGLSLPWIGCGGALGSLCRYLSASWLSGFGFLPWGTITVNTAGSFALGYLLARPLLDARLRAAAGIGFLGSFTTFSSFAIELPALSRQPWHALLYLALTLALGLLAAGLGLRLGRQPEQIGPQC